MANPGEGPPYFSTKMTPEGRKNLFLETATAPLSQGLDDQPPPTLGPRELLVPGFLTQNGVVFTLTQFAAVYIVTTFRP